MKKSNLILLVIVGILTIVVITIYFWENNDKQRVYRDFAVEDTASINKIFLADKNNNSVTLERKGTGWIVNEKYEARRALINVLLTTIRNIEISSPVPKPRVEKVLKDLSVQGIKTEIYQNDKLVKTYYVGGVTMDNTGTYMIMEGSDVPFILALPNFSGYLTVRYLPDIKEWRERVIFNYSVDQIAQVKVEYGNNPDDGFIAYCSEDKKYSITKIDGSKVDFPVDSLAIKEFISRSKFIAFEAFIKEELQQHKLDSLLNQPMAARFEVVDRDGNAKSFRTYLRPNINQAFDTDGNLYEWDIDRLYGIVNNDSEVVFLQYYVIDPITLTINDFNLNNRITASVE